jgi:hypothetical protein
MYRKQLYKYDELKELLNQTKTQKENLEKTVNEDLTKLKSEHDIALKKIRELELKLHNTTH